MDIKVNLDLNKYKGRYKLAQWWLGNRVLESCKACMPLQTGSLQQRSHVEDRGAKVVFPGPYARYLYHGKVMVDSVTGKGPRKVPTGPGEYVLRFKKGAKLVPTGRSLSYSQPQAVPYWFEHAKAQYEQSWIDGVTDVLQGKRR